MHCNQVVGILSDRIKSLNYQIMLANVDITEATQRRDLAIQQLSQVQSLLLQIETDAEHQSIEAEELHADQSIDSVTAQVSSTRGYAAKREAFIEAHGLKSKSDELPANVLTPEAKRAYALAVAQKRKQRQSLQESFANKKSATLIKSGAEAKRIYPSQRRSNLTANILDVLRRHTSETGQSMSLRQIVNELNLNEDELPIKEGSVRTTLHGLKKRELISRDSTGYRLQDA